MNLGKYSTETSIEPCSNNELEQEWVLMRGLNDLRSQRHLADVTIIVEGKSLPACHRAVLAASSPYFKAMFTHDLAERNKPEIEIKELQYNIVSSIIDFLYTGKIEILDDNAQDLLTASSILQVPLLYGKCSRFMQKRLTEKNCLDMYSFAKCLCCTELQNEAFAMVCKRFLEISKTDSFLELSKADFIDFLSSDDLSVEEESVVYEAALSWALHDVTERGRFIDEVLSYVRFVLLDDDYLDKCIFNVELLSEFSHLSSQISAARLYKTKMKEKFSHESLFCPNQDDIPLSPQHSLDNDLKVKNVNNGQDDVTTQNEDKHSSVDTDQHRREIQNKDLTFLDCPYYEITWKNSEKSIRIPLVTSPRAGMLETDLLLFTNGRKTVIFDPIKRRYFSGVECSKCKNETSSTSSANKKEVLGVDLSMPEMKNVDVYAARNGTVFLIGGLEVDKSTPITTLRSRVYIFDMNSCKWKSRKSLGEPRCMMGLGELNGCFVVSGGKILSSGEISPFVKSYDSETDSWFELLSLPKAIYGHQCASVSQGIYVIGGKTQEQEILKVVYFLDSQNQQWTESPSLNVPRFLAGATVLRSSLVPSKRKSPQQETIYVVGGVSDDGLLSNVEVFHPLDERWKFVEDFPGNRCAQFVTTINGEICAVGGHVTERSQEGRFESIQKYDAFLLERLENSSEKSYKWKRIVRHIRGIFETSFACSGIRINTRKLISA